MKNTRWAYWVERKDGQRDLTVPFEARDRAHATEWINQPWCNGAFRIVRRPARQEETIDDLRAQLAALARAAIAYADDATNPLFGQEAREKRAARLREMAERIIREGANGEKRD